MAELWGTIPLNDPVINIKDNDKEKLTVVMSWERAEKIANEFKEYFNTAESLDEISWEELISIFEENGIYLPELAHLWEKDL
jgi:hypothetical protein